MSNISTAFGKIKLMSGSVKSLATLLTLQACNNSKEMAIQLVYILEMNVLIFMV